MTPPGTDFPRIAWVGSHFEGLPAFHALVEAGHPPACVVTLSERGREKRSGAHDYPRLCAEFDIPCLQVDDINSPEASEWLKGFSPDLLVVLGWSQILKPHLLEIPSLGSVGAHASLLPEMRGSAPVNWAIIRGLKETGNTLIELSEAVDDGDILGQRRIAIGPRDTCATVYEKVAETNREMILELLEQVRESGRLAGEPQPMSEEPLLPRRRPKDGLIDWSQPPDDVYNFIRALTRPYPGAFTFMGGRRWLVWEAACLPAAISVEAEPGEVLGVEIGPERSGIVVACLGGAIVITEIEDDSGRVYSGPDLDDICRTKDRFISE